MAVTKEQIDAMVADAREAVRLDREQPGLPFRKYEMKNEKLTRVVAALADQRAELVALLQRILRTAADPMNSMDAGRVIDATQVEELCEEALEKIGVKP